MDIASDLVAAFNDGLKQGRDKIERLERELRECRNELCLRCGDYKQRHLGACDGCRWRADNG